MKKKWLFACFFCLLFAGCASDTTAPESVKSPEQMYSDAMKLMDESEPTLAIKELDALEREHPYSVWASRGQIMAAYLSYRTEKYTDALLILDRFLQIHPGNKNAPYAYYLKGLCYFEQISDIQREQENTVQALKAFQELLLRYPQTLYKEDALKRISFIQNQLAGKEMALGRYYLKAEVFPSAINHFQTVLKDYPQTKQAPEAFYRLMEAYLALGMNDYVSKADKALQEKYPTNDWNLRARRLLKKYSDKTQQQPVK
jgi:outer membrane protein assembly factor BamD